MASTITVNVNNEVATVFRNRVHQIYGRRKGSLGKAFTEAMKTWSEQKEYLDSCLKLLNKGIDMGKLRYKTREELHDRD